MRCAACESSRYDCALGETLGARNFGIGDNYAWLQIRPSAFYPRKCCRSPGFCWDRVHFTLKSAAGPHEMEVAIKGRSHFRGCPLAWSSSLIFRNRSICIWRAFPEAIQSGLTTGITHTECNQTTFRQGSDLLIFRCRHSATPVI